MFEGGQTENTLQESIMALNTEQQRIISQAKDRLKAMNQIPSLEKEISSLRKKLEIKENRLSELIDILDYKNPKTQSSFEGDDADGKPIDPSDLFS